MFIYKFIVTFIIVFTVVGLLIRIIPVISLLHTHRKLKRLERAVREDPDLDMNADPEPEWGMDTDNCMEKDLCVRLKERITVDLAFWNEMRLEFKSNRIPLYSTLKFNFEGGNRNDIP